MIHYLITILLGPLLLIQGIYVKWKTPVLPEAPGPRKGLTGKGSPISVLVIGDSAAAGVGAQHQNRALLGQLINNLSRKFKVSWQLEAESGAKTISSLSRIDHISDCHFDVVLTSLGVNDVIANISVRKWIRQQTLLYQKCFDQLSNQCIIVTCLPPMHKFPALPQPLRWYFGRRANQFNRVLKKLVANKKGIHFLSLDIMDDNTQMAIDGFHPSEKIYKQWANHSANLIISKVNETN